MSFSWLFIGLALQATTGSGLVLRWTAPPECPSIEVPLAQELRGASKQLSATVTVRRVDEAWWGEVVFARAGLPTRTIRADSCAEMQRAVTVVLMLAATQAPRAPVANTAQTMLPPESKEPHRWAFGLMMGLDAGLTTVVGLNYGVTAARLGPYWRVEGGVRGWVNGQTMITWDLKPIVSGSIRACWGRDAGWCVVGDGGITEPAAREFQLRPRSFWLAVFAGGTVPLMRNDDTVLRASIELGTAVIQPRYQPLEKPRDVQLYFSGAPIVRGTLGMEFEAL